MKSFFLVGSQALDYSAQRTPANSLAQDCTTLIHSLLRALALALTPTLSLPTPSTLSGTNSHNHSKLRLLHYPSPPYVLSPQATRCA